MIITNMMEDTTPAMVTATTLHLLPTWATIITIITGIMGIETAAANINK